MRNDIKIDFINNTIIMTREFAKLASDVRSQEYAMLQKARSNNPEYSVKVRTIKKNPNKETYKGLTYAYMERYIITHETREQATETLTKLAEMYQLATKNMSSQSSIVPLIMAGVFYFVMNLVVQQAFNAAEKKLSYYK